MAGKAGIDSDKPVEICMVKGCTRKALYRNPISAKTCRTARGYCRIHKDMATPALSDATMQNMQNWYDRGQKE